MTTRALGDLRRHPECRLFVEDDEILSGRNADDDLAQLAPFMMDAKVHDQTRA